MVELLGAVVEMIVAMVQAIVAIVGAVLEALGAGVSHLATRPEEGESRFSGKRLLAACAPLVLVVLVVVGVFAFCSWQNRVRRARELATRELVEANVQRLANQVDEDGHLVKHPTATLSVDDAWGNPLHVAYDETLTSRRVVVSSAGDDETVGTWDDVTSARRLPRKKQEIAIGLLGTANAIVRQITDHESPKN